MVDSVVYTTPNIEVTMTKDINAMAYFDTTTQKQDAVEITADTGGTTFPPPGTHYLIHGSTATITAIPDTGKVFDKWVINGIETTNNPVNYKVMGDAVIEAYFKNKPVGIKQITTKTNNVVSLYPNPSNGHTTISSISEINSLNILDATGKEVYSQDHIGTTNVVLDLKHLNSGIYFVKLFTKTEYSVFKLQIAK
jgi:hypothetical protein